MPDIEHHPLASRFVLASDPGRQATLQYTLRPTPGMAAPGMPAPGMPAPGMSAPGTPISKPIPSGPDADTPHPLTAMDIYHVFVPPELRGRGVAAALVEKALAHARAQRMLVVPTCPYVAQYLRQHPEHADLLRPPSA